MTVFYEFKHIMITLIAKVKEKTMANKKIGLGILAIVLAFGMVVVGCDGGCPNNYCVRSGTQRNWDICNNQNCSRARAIRQDHASIPRCNC